MLVSSELILSQSVLMMHARTVKNPQHKLLKQDHWYHKNVAKLYNSILK